MRKSGVVRVVGDFHMIFVQKSRDEIPLKTGVKPGTLTAPKMTARRLANAGLTRIMYMRI